MLPLPFTLPRQDEACKAVSPASAGAGARRPSIGTPARSQTVSTGRGGVAAACAEGWRYDATL